MLILRQLIHCQHFPPFQLPIRVREVGAGVGLRRLGKGPVQYPEDRSLPSIARRLLRQGEAYETRGSVPLPGEGGGYVEASVTASEFPASASRDVAHSRISNHTCGNVTAIPTQSRSVVGPVPVGHLLPSSGRSIARS